ncbi:MAG: hypothetical protein ACPH3N_05260 [Alcanivorax sediminis]|uniref:Uncharacterized protein n=1 Tax=Alcanivorax sediminis TaxID=2663008 RepID=A0A6N7LP03_9GAMM|nr:hypothetical protein [Alcanivorax sediminis]MQX51838.1 hypothetical protein [Alcanivorax sediminis]
MKRAARIRIHALMMAARQRPMDEHSLLRQALRLAQQALASNAADRDAIRSLGMLWWRLGARQRGRALLGLG